VSREDCARAAAAALASDSSSNARYDITGPQAQTTAQIAAAVSEVAGKPIEVIQVSDEQIKQGMLGAGLPEPIAALMVAFDANTRAGKANVASDAVEKLTGKPAQSLVAFLKEHRAALG
jgi:NAD(P)H dehydrogenase (quinone)